jgi:hypothetical protein
MASEPIASFILCSFAVWRYATVFATRLVRAQIKQGKDQDNWQGAATVIGAAAKHHVTDQTIVIAAGTVSSGRLG